jgi:hypothetical protein
MFIGSSQIKLCPNTHPWGMDILLWDPVYYSQHTLILHNTPTTRRMHSKEKPHREHPVWQNNRLLLNISSTQLIPTMLQMTISTLSKFMVKKQTAKNPCYGGKYVSLNLKIMVIQIEWLLTKIIWTILIPCQSLPPYLPYLFPILWVVITYNSKRTA